MWAAHRGFEARNVDGELVGNTVIGENSNRPNARSRLRLALPKKKLAAILPLAPNSNSAIACIIIADFQAPVDPYLLQSRRLFDPSRGI